jgi:hypothetical protein
VFDTFLPEEQTTITLYPLWIDRLAKPNTFYALRRVLKKCTWSDETQTIQRNSGLIAQNPFESQIPRNDSGLTYIPPHIWYNTPRDELEGYWTVDTSMANPRPLIVPFECDDELAQGVVSSAMITNMVTLEHNNAGTRRIHTLDDNEGARDKQGIVTVPKMGSHILLGAR